MPMKLNVGVSQKVGLPNYGSVGASCNLEMELDAGLLEKDLDGFHARIRAAYVAAHQAVHDELARLHAPATPVPDHRHRREPEPRPGTALPGRTATVLWPRESRAIEHGLQDPRQRTRSRRSRRSREGRTPTWWACCVTSTRSSGPRICRSDRPAS